VRLKRARVTTARRDVASRLLNAQRSQIHRHAHQWRLNGAGLLGRRWSALVLESGWRERQEVLQQRQHQRRLLEIIRRQDEEIKALRDEIHKFKGTTQRPKIEPSRLLKAKKRRRVKPKPSGWPPTSTASSSNAPATRP